MSLKIVERFKERDDKIQVLVLNTFAALLRSSFITQCNTEVEATEISLLRARSSVEELYKHVDVFTPELLKITSTKNQTIKVAILNVLLEMAKTMNHLLLPSFPSFLPFIKGCFE